jgi:hypothetical protein
MAIAPQLRASIQLSIPARRISTGGIGVTEGYGTVTNTDVELGRMVTAADVQAAARVIVLGPIRSRPSCSAISTRRGRASASTGCRSGSWGCSRRKAPALGPTMTMSPWSPSVPRANASPPRPDEAKADLVRLLRDRYSVGQGEVQPFRHLGRRSEFDPLRTFLCKQAVVGT